jgi:hypothetical protein
MKYVKTTKGQGITLEIKLDKVKVQLVDSGGHYTKIDWFDITEVEEVESIPLSDLYTDGYKNSYLEYLENSSSFFYYGHN